MNPYRTALDLYEQGETFCLAVVVAKSGSAPQVPGAKGIFLRDGRILGTIGGGCLEMEARRLAMEALHTGRPVHREFQLDDDFGWDDGLICGGRVQVLLLPRPETFAEAFRHVLDPRASGALVYNLKSGSVRFEPARTGSPVADEPTSTITARSVETRREVMADGEFAEPVLPPEKLIIFGGGHIGRELARVGADLGFAVTVVDDRPEFVSEERVPWAAERACDLPDAFAAAIDPDGDTYICIVTRGHRNDAKVLRELIRKPRAYLGMIGSRRKLAVIRKEMLAAGLCTPEEFDAVRCPMGLDIGAESVAEIAVSIAAELVQVRAERRGPILARCGQRPLHGRHSSINR